MRKIILLTLVLIPVFSFAAWSQPTATPPNGNTQPPINTGNSEQTKQGGINALKFCLLNGWCFDTSGITTGRICLGGSCINSWDNPIASYFNNNFANYFNNLNNSDDLAKVTSRGANTGQVIGVGGLNSVGDINIINGSLCLGGDCRNSWPSSSGGGSGGGATTGGGVAGVSSITAGPGISVSSNTGDVVISATGGGNSSGGGGTAPVQPGPVTITSYNQLPSGSVAGWCMAGDASFGGSGLWPAPVAPAKRAQQSWAFAQYSVNCSCETGWTVKRTGTFGEVYYGNAPRGSNAEWYFTCVKN